MKAAYRFTLYVAGTGPRSTTATQNLRRLCEQRLADGDYDVDVVDVLEALREAEAARILVTPTVVRTNPLPVVRVMGELSVTKEIADALGLPDRTIDTT